MAKKKDKEIKENIVPPVAEDAPATEDAKPKHSKKADETIEATVEKVYSQKDMELVATELQKVKTERDQYLDMAQRQKAEFDNYRKRSETQRLEANGNGAREAITAILPVLDNMQRAMAGCADIDDSDPVKSGVTMVFGQFNEALKSQGLASIEAVGAEFDPNFHHAVVEGEANDEYPAGTVMEVLQEGYMVKEKIIRYAMVKVAK